jgi:hypothetical protein
LLRAFFCPRRASRGGVSRVVRNSLIANGRRFRPAGHPNSSLFSVFVLPGQGIAPRNHAGFRAAVCTPQRIAVGFRTCSTRSRSAARLAGNLDRWARHRAVGTEHAAVARLGFEHRVAALALVEPLTGVGGHPLCLHVPAYRAGQCRIE